MNAVEFAGMLTERKLRDGRLQTSRAQTHNAGSLGATCIVRPEGDFSARGRAISLHWLVGHALPWGVDTFAATIGMRDIEAKPLAADLEIMDLRVVDLVTQT